MIAGFPCRRERGVVAAVRDGRLPQVEEREAARQHGALGDCGAEGSADPVGLGAAHEPYAELGVRVRTGHEVAVEIDDQHRDRAQVLADEADRLDDRREALKAKTARHQAASDAAYERAGELAKRRPFGQPILVGHHSERSARADQRRI
ncbi:MAG: DUF3560 domain-containing protein, partial [Micromonosporaceae bacterium]